MMLQLVVLAIAALASGVKGGPVTMGMVLHVADFHLDLNYSQFGDPTKRCHYMGGDNQTNIGAIGNYNCDSSTALVLSAIEAMRNVTATPDAIVWTGDSMPHQPNALYDTQAVIDTVTLITKELRKAFPQTNVYAVLGNHDFWPADQHPDTANPIYRAVNDLWSDWLHLNGSTTLANFGYYTVRLTPERALLALNTNLYYVLNRVNFTDPVDPAGQFAWMEAQLDMARAGGYKAHVMAHVPPGAFERTARIVWFKADYSERLLGIFRNYSDVIDWMLFGHDHTDTFRLLQTADNATKTLFLAPAVTPWKYSLIPHAACKWRIAPPRSTLPGAGANNPAFRQILYDRQTWNMQDLKTHYLNLAKANMEGRAEWQLEYSHVDVYGGVSDEAMAAAVGSMQTNDTLFQRYFKLNSVSYDTYECSGACKQIQLCTIKYLNLDDYLHCLLRSATTTRPPVPTPSIAVPLQISLFLVVLSSVLWLF